jgi:hypothetical protein
VPSGGNRTKAGEPLRPQVIHDGSCSGVRAAGVPRTLHRTFRCSGIYLATIMSRFFEPDLTTNPDSPFVRDASSKLVRRSYWMDMLDSALVMVMTKGIGANLTNDEKRAHLIDLRREHLIDQVCPQEILPPEK